MSVHDHDPRGEAGTGGRRRLQALLDGVAEHAGDADPALLLELTRASYRRTPDEALDAADPAAIAARMRLGLAFLVQRPLGSLALRVRDPQPDEGGDTTVVECAIEDGPFLLSTMTEELVHRGHPVGDSLHPIVGVERDADGRLRAITPARRAASRESYIRIQLQEALDEAERETVRGCLEAVLRDALAATRDFAAMGDRIREIAFRTRSNAGVRYGLEQVDETSALLRWLLDDHFVVLGVREYDLIDTEGGPAIVVQPGTGLGILADERRSSYARPVALAEMPPPLRERVEGQELLVVSRTNRPSTVHRRARMISIGVKKVADDGELAGEYRILGLFSQKAYAEPAGEMPVLRRKLQRILELEDIVQGSHDERSVRGLFEAFPTHELFESGTEDLRRSMVELLEAQKRQDVRVLARLDERRQTVSILVAVPRERFNTEVRRRIQRLLVDAYGAGGVDYHLSISERDQTLLHFVLYLDGEIPTVSLTELERTVGEITRRWEDDLTAALIEAKGPSTGGRLARAYRGLFPPGYADTTPVDVAVLDVDELEGLVRGDAERAVRMTLQRTAREEPVRFKLYKIGAGVELSRFMPILESLGLVVVEEVPHRISGVEVVGEVHLHDFGVRSDDPQVDLDVDRDGPRLADAAMAMWTGATEVDSLNRLVLRGGLPWRDVEVLRAYRRYRRQVGTSFTEAYTNQALLQHPDVACALIDLFDARFNPGRAAEPGAADRARAAVLAGCDAVERLDQDRILRGWLAMIEATLRTNRYIDDPPRPFLSLKLDSAAVPQTPKPVPHVEVFVYSPQLEAIHLRGGPVARGGLRWSDRQEDFRTEVLGLMKAQIVKNAVIVPSGSKGGFVLKRPPVEPRALREEVRRRYRDFIRGLLDVTDNVVGGEVVPPRQVRRHDGDDPYLVVAADRGTATFSDVANEISEEYGFWLGDAFASGGSRGYDHKAMGITARGAWVAVQRHFRELGVDVQADPVTVVGIGDMSGDVFGNGLLRSRTVRLVAAFDHRDIFVDPDPDPAASYEERRRLFELPGSSWRDYDHDLISPGGGVWSRTAKEIRLSPEVRRALRIEAEQLSPPELVQHILRAPTDLLFAGGIGTFVKATGESHADVGDRVNDGIRIDADELGARVVGEGGNLALTQLARIQYARRGGRCNTDAVDNSAGVDTSDREVNLKILLRLAVEAGELDAHGRDELLRDMTEEVASHVQRDVYLQTGAISQELAHSPGGLEAYEAFMAEMEAAGRLDRSVEALPSTEEMHQRRRAGAGLTRPELAVLLGYAKIDLIDALLDSDLPDQPSMQDVLRDYFPSAAVERFGHLMSRLRLRRELVATIVGNDLVNRMGITYASRTAGELGRDLSDVAACYWIVRQITGAAAHWQSIEALDGRAEPSLQLELKAVVDRLVNAGVRRYLRGDDARDVGAAIARDAPSFDDLEKVVTDLGSTGRQARRRARARRFIDLGIDDALAEQIVGAAELAFVPEVAAVARESGQPVRHVADVFLHLGDVLPLGVLQGRLDELEPSGNWERWQHRQLDDEIRDVRRVAAAAVVQRYPEANPREAVHRYLQDCEDACRRAEVLIERLREEPDAGLPAVAVGVRALREALKG
jgi:glutamate dehydrogenase